MKSLNLLIFTFLILSYSSLSECISTYSIDLSSEFIKVAIVIPGVPMEIALNGESQRKTSAVVFIKGEERLFGEAAMNMGVKFPKNLYHSLTTLIGKTIDNDTVQDFLRNFPYYDLFMDNNNQLSFRDGNIAYTVEELLAMVLANARNIAEIYSEMPMKGCVVVVPPFFTQDERLAVLRAAEIADVNILQLINSNTAVGLNYGIFRRKSFNSTVQYYMFYDVGSSATIASIIGYQVLKDSSEGFMMDTPQLSVVGVGYDRTLGASQFTLRIQMHIAKAFNAAKMTKTDVTTVPRSMAKLYKEAARVVKVLSANNEIHAQIENVLDDKDFKLKITRSQFEELCKDLFERFSEPVHRALESAQIPMPVIKEIILMGGGTRIPRIQDILLKTSDRLELGKAINTDEAAALGAVYQAAFISPGFKVQTFLVKDSNLLPISVDFLRYKTENEKESAYPTSRILFDTMNHFPQKKVMTFNKQTQNFDFNVSSGTVDIDQKVLYHVSVNNLTDVYNGNMEPSENSVTEFKGVKAHFAIDNSGLLVLNYIEAIFERKWLNGDDTEETSTLKKLGNTISNFFGSSSEEKIEKKESDKINTEGEEKKEDIVKDSGNSTSTNQTVSNNNTDSKNNESQTVKPKQKVIHQRLSFVSTWKSFIIPSEKANEISRQRLLKLKAIDDQKWALEKSKNELESYIFDVKSRFEKEIYVKCSTEAERNAALAEAISASEWYEEQGVDTAKEEYSTKYSGLMKLMQDIDLRVKEHSLRPEAVAKLTSMLNTSNVFLNNLQNMSGDGDGKVLTKAEYDSLWRLINDTTKWLTTTKITFKTMKLYENPMVVVTDFDTHMQALEREMRYLLNKISIWKSQTPPPPPPTSSSSTNGSVPKEPSVDKEEPSVYKVEPSVDKVEPSVDKVEPSVDKVEPSVDKEEPSVDKVEPSVDKVEPSVDKVEPETPPTGDVPVQTETTDSTRPEKTSTKTTTTTTKTESKDNGAPTATSDDRHIDL